MPQRKIPRGAFQLSAPVQLQDADVEEGQGSGQRRWQGVAYTGDPLRLSSLDDERLVIDLETLESPTRTLPVLVGHDRDRIAGYADQIDVGQQLTVGGGLLQSTEHGQIVASASDEGFPWQLSVDARPGRIEEVQRGNEVEVNGQSVSGPAIIFRDTRLAEVSFTSVGVDHNTTAAALSDESITVQTTAPEETMDPNKQQTQQGQQTQQQSTGQEPTFAQLQQQLAEEQQARQQAEQQLADERRERRKGEVRTLFADIGREFTEQAAEPYIQMADETFKAVAQDLRQHAGQGQQQGTQRPTPPDGATLQSEQATGTPGTTEASDDDVADQLAKL